MARFEWKRFPYDHEQEGALDCNQDAIVWALNQLEPHQRPIEWLHMRSPLSAKHDTSTVDIFYENMEV